MPARAKGVTAGAERGRVVAGAAQLARDLANTPPGHLTARRMAEIAIEVAASSGLEVDVFDEAALAEMECGGLLGVNAGSEEPARMVRLRYRPRGTAGRRPVGDGRQGGDVRLRRYQPEAH